MTTYTLTFLHWRFWLAAFVILILLLWLFSPILLPFVLGLTLAYFLDPIVDRLERAGAHRSLGALAALFVFCCIFGLLLVLLVPLVQQQVSAFIEKAPGYIEHLRSSVLPWIRETFDRFLPSGEQEIQKAATAYAGDAAGVVGNLLKTAGVGALAIVDTVALLIITPVVAFYMLRDWDKMIRAVDKALPLKTADIIRAEARKVDQILEGFLRGQGLVCVCLAAYYAIALALVGLDFGVTVGLLAGLLSFIPYVGSITGFIASMGLAFAQFDRPEPIVLVFAIYMIGQAVEGNVLAPKLVGDRVGLHPVWVIFALMAGGSLFGFVGVLVALPVAAVLGVLVRFMLNQYLHSKYYKDN
ncbi:MAG: AI-2E family transporter [Bdellovibrionales bacterium]